jgi:hypothetical protein
VQDFYRCLSGYEATAQDNAMFICQKFESDMIYELRFTSRASRKTLSGRLSNMRKYKSRTCEQYMEVNMLNSFFLDYIYSI